MLFSLSIYMCAYVYVHIRKCGVPIPKTELKRVSQSCLFMLPNLLQNSTKVHLLISKICYNSLTISNESKILILDTFQTKLYFYIWFVVKKIFGPSLRFYWSVVTKNVYRQPTSIFPALIYPRIFLYRIYTIMYYLYIFIFVYDLNEWLWLVNLNIVIGHPNLSCQKTRHNKSNVLENPVPQSNLCLSRVGSALQLYLCVLIVHGYLMPLHL